MALPLLKQGTLTTHLPLASPELIQAGYISEDFSISFHNSPIFTTHLTIGTSELGSYCTSSLISIGPAITEVLRTRW